MTSSRFYSCGRIKEMYPELYERMPSDYIIFGWNLDFKGYEKRIEVLEDIIKTMESE